jgi:hypothetical protein
MYFSKSHRLHRQTQMQIRATQHGGSLTVNSQVIVMIAPFGNELITEKSPEIGTF